MPKEPNPCNRTVTRKNAYEVWQTRDGSWTWYVLKKWQSPSNEAKNPYARWYCNVVSPLTSERGETGDVYCADIKAAAVKLDYNPLHKPLLEFILELLDAAGKRKAYDAQEPIELDLAQVDMAPLNISIYQGGDRSISIGKVVHRDSHGDVCEIAVALRGSGELLQVRQLYGEWYTPRDEYGNIIPEVKEQAEAFVRTWVQTLRSEGWIEIAAGLKGETNKQEW